MANKQTTEFMILPAKFVDSIYQSLEDGAFEPLKDFPNFLDDFLTIQPAVQGINEIKTENATMTIAEREALFNSVSDAMPNVDADDRFDIASGMTGLLSWFRIAWRKGYQKGIEKGREIERTNAASATKDDPSA